MNATRTLFTAAALAGLFGAAQAAPLSVTGQGENFGVTYADDHRGNILGGGAVRVEGNSRDLRIVHEDSRFTRRARGIPVDLGGGNGDLAYLPAPVAAGMIASR